MKIAIVHEMLVKLGGAEKVVENWMKLFPDAPVYTLMYDENIVGEIFPKNKIHPQVFHTSTQKIYSLCKKQRFCLPFMAKSIESFDVSAYDIVLVSSSGFAHGIITNSETKTIIYYHSPARYLWDWTNEYKKDIGAQNGIKWYILGRLFLKLRQWDYLASQRKSIALANSNNTAKRIRKYYKKTSQVLYPPIETERFSQPIKHSFSLPYKSESYYIVISALTEFKRIDIAIEKFKDMPEVNLVIIGSWSYEETLKEIAAWSKNISFVWRKLQDELVFLAQNSLGLIFPWEEDFGIVPIEAMAAGQPVFALKKGGLTESVVAWETWEFFQDSEGEDFNKEFEMFHKNNLLWVYSKEKCKKQAKQFDSSIFEKHILDIIK